MGDSSTTPDADGLARPPRLAKIGTGSRFQCAPHRGPEPRRGQRIAQRLHGVAKKIGTQAKMRCGEAPPSREAQLATDQKSSTIAPRTAEDSRIREREPTPRPAQPPRWSGVPRATSAPCIADGRPPPPDGMNRRPNDEDAS